jgi:hypothetical protein
MRLTYHHKFRRTLTLHLSTINCQLPTANCQLPTVNCQLPTVNCQLSTANCQLPTVNCQLSTANYQLPTANCQLPTANCQLPTVNCQLSTVNCLRPFFDRNIRSIVNPSIYLSRAVNTVCLYLFLPVSQPARNTGDRKYRCKQVCRNSHFAVN